jgi:pyruvate,water dikinase
VDDVDPLAKTGGRIRQWIIETPLPSELEAAIIQSLERMSQGRSLPPAPSLVVTALSCTS